MDVKDNHSHIDKIEAEFPALSGIAFEQARERVLASGQSVLQVEDGNLYKVGPDQTKVLIKQVDPAIPVKPGTRIKL